MPASNFLIMSGNPTQTSIVLNCVSLYSGNVVITVPGAPGSPYTVTMTQFATDRGTADPGGQTFAGYQGSTGVAITGLTPFTKYTYTAIQGSRSIAEQQFHTAPRNTDDFAIVFGSCDNPGDTIGVGPVSATGMYPFYKNYAINGDLPVVAFLYHDDLGYTDSASVVSTDDTAGSGRKLTGAPKNTLLQYNYAVGHMCWLGLLQDETKSRIAFGNVPERQWCLRNIPFLPQLGDHEFVNDFREYSIDVDTDGTLYAAAMAAWDKIYLPLQGPSRGVAASSPWPAAISVLDPAANHYAVDLGPLRIITTDAFANSTGLAHNWVTNPGTESTAVMLGSNQINDVRNGGDTTQPFKLQTMYMGPRSFGPPVSPGYLYGVACTHPYFEGFPTEWKQWFTTTTTTGGIADSVMKSNRTNGVLGQTVLLSGDMHVGKVVHNYAPAYSGNLAENFLWVTPGTINGSTPHGVPPVITGTGFVLKPAPSESGTGYSNLDGNTPVATLDFLDAMRTDNAAAVLAPQTSQFFGLRLEVYGSRSPKEMHAHFLNDQGNTVWSRKWVQWFTDNAGIAVDADAGVPKVSVRRTHT